MQPYTRNSSPLRVERFLLLLIFLIIGIGVLRSVSRPTFDLSTDLTWGRENQPLGDYHVDEDVHVKVALVPLAEALGDCEGDKFCRYAASNFQEGLLYRFYQKLILTPFQWLPNHALLIWSRIGNLFLHLGLVLLTWRLAKSLTSSDSFIPQTAATLVALTPTISDLYSGMNLESAAGVGGALLLWLAFRIVNRQKLNWQDWLLLAAGCLLITIRVQTMAPLMLGIAFAIWVRWSPRIRYAVLLGLVLIGIVGMVVVRPFNLPGAAYWFYQDVYTSYGPRNPMFPTQTTDAKFGETAMVLPHFRAKEPVVQYLVNSDAVAMSGETVTVGGWYRVLAESYLAQVYVEVNDQKVAEPVTLSTNASTDWQYFSATYTLPMDIQTLAVGITAPEENQIYEDVIAFDGLFLLSGVVEQPPSEDIILTGNLLRNGSFEQSWRQTDSRLRTLGLNVKLGSIYYLERTWTGWLHAPRALLSNYWGSFNSIHPALTRAQLLPLYLLTVVALIGLLQLLPQFRKNKLYQLLLVFAFASSIVILYRVLIFPHKVNVFVWAGTRHGSTAYATFSLLLALGLSNVIKWPSFRRYFPIGLLIMLVAFNIYSIVMVQIPLYNCTDASLAACLNF